MIIPLEAVDLDQLAKFKIEDRVLYYDGAQTIVGAIKYRGIAMIYWEYNHPRKQVGVIYMIEDTNALGTRLSFEIPQDNILGLCDEKGVLLDG